MKVTIVTTMRNEGAHLLEWVAHHRAAGVSDFLVYVNDCEDSTETLLSLLPNVHVMRQTTTQKSPQWQALRAAWDHPVVAGADWVACIDCDEFINLDKSLESIPHLAEHVGGDAILLPWRLFGSNGHHDLTAGWVTERFTRAAAPDMLYPALGSHFKTLFRRAGPFRQFGVHRPKQKNAGKHGAPIISDGSGAQVRDPLQSNDGQIMNWGQPIARSLVQLNHYSIKSAADFMIKRARGLPNHTEKQIDLTYWVERNFNHVEDRSISHMRGTTAVQEAAFLAIPGVKSAHEACQDWYKKSFERAVATPDGLKLYGRLQLAQESAALGKDQALSLVDAYRRVHAAG